MDESDGDDVTEREINPKGEEVTAAAPNDDEERDGEGTGDSLASILGFGDCDRVLEKELVGDFDLLLLNLIENINRDDTLVLFASLGLLFVWVFS